MITNCGINIDQSVESPNEGLPGEINLVRTEGEGTECRVEGTERGREKEDTQSTDVTGGPLMQ